MKYFEEVKAFRWPAAKAKALVDVEKWIYKVKPIFIQRVALRLFFLVNLPRYVRYFVPGSLYLPWVGLTITTKCTLLCKDCSAMIPMYATQHNTTQHNTTQHIGADVLLRHITDVLEAVDGVVTLTLTGGEPMLHPDICKIVKALSASCKIECIYLITNATYIPNDLTLDIMRECGVFVLISDYGILSVKKNELIDVLKRTGIVYKIFPMNNGWVNLGGTSPRGRSIDEMRGIFLSCSSQRFCKNIMFNKFYVCSRAAHAQALGLYPEEKSEFVDLNDGIEQIRSEIRELYLLES